MTGAVRTGTAIALLAVLLAVPAAAAPGWRVSLGPTLGAVRLDPSLADYQWSVDPGPVWGGQVTAGRGRVGLGIRILRSSTRQSSGAASGPSPVVRLTGTELVAEGRVARLAGVRLLLLAGGGRIHLGYSPDRATYDPLGTGDEIEVRFEPIDEWMGSLGLAVRRGVAHRVELGASLERYWFSLDTAHRQGEEIVERRETFGNWTGRAGLFFTL